MMGALSNGADGIMLNNRRERLGFSTGDLAKATGISPGRIRELYDLFDIPLREWNKLNAVMQEYQNKIPHIRGEKLYTTHPTAMRGMNTRSGREFDI